MGRPAFEPTDAQRVLVKSHAAYGTPQDDICLLVLNPSSGLPIDIKTLQKHFRRELDIGMVEANAKVGESLFMQAVGRPAQYDAEGCLLREELKPAVAAAIFWAKARMGWKEPPQDHQHSGKGGGPIPIVDLSGLSNEQLAALEPILAALAGSAQRPAESGQGGNAPARARSGTKARR